MGTHEVILSGLSHEPHKLSACWGMGNNLVVFPAPKSTTASNSGRPVRMQHVTWETTINEPIFRKLVNESLQVFLNLKKMAKADEGIANGPLVRVSRQYRSIIRDCQEQLDAQLEHNESRNLRDLSEVLYKLELIWNLVEILFVERTPCGTVFPQLLTWIGEHFHQCNEKARNVLAGASESTMAGDDVDEFLERPDLHPDYWDAIVLCLLQAKLTTARKLLALHADFTADAFASMDELLRKMPLYSSNVSLPDFEFRWRQWQKEVASRANEGDFATEPHLTEIAEILSGSSEPFHGRIRDLCETWYEWMVGHLLYTNPSVKVYDLSAHAEEAIGMFGGLSAMTSLDSIILAAMEWDIPQVMKELCTTLDNTWFPAHLLDLLHHTDHQLEEASSDLSDYQPRESLREFLLLEYATTLMSHTSLWQVGVLYLDNCPVQGRQRLELLLERVPLINERRAEKVLSIASERGIMTVSTVTCKVMGMRALHSNRIGTAMAWALRSQDATYTTFLAERLLQRYIEDATFSVEDLLDHLGSCMIVSDRLIFLAKYQEFHRMAQANDFKSAATLLHSLLWSKLAPKYFWVTLLVDALPFLTAGSNLHQLLQKEDIYFTSLQTSELMRCLKELCQERSSLPKKQQLLLEEHEKILRLMMAKNLARASLEEGDARDQLL